ncbi:MAG: hypothetical protein ACXVFL_17740 [Solirubrobacteraceae bacterium]
MHAVHSAAQARDRLAELSAGAWLYTAVGVAVEAGMLPLLSEPRDPSQLAAATGLPEALAGALADALVATGLARRSGAGVVAEPGLAELAGPGAAPVGCADLRTGLLQMAALFDAATRCDRADGAPGRRPRPDAGAAARLSGAQRRSASVVITAS